MAALAAGALLVPASAAAETFTTTATITPAAPTVVTAGNLVRVDVDFGTPFDSIGSVCFTIAYHNDVRETGEEIVLGFPPVIDLGDFILYGSGAIGGPVGEGDGQSTMCLAEGDPLTEFFVDGQQDLYLADGYPAPTGSLVVHSVTVTVDGSRPFPSNRAACRDGGWAAFSVFKNQGDCESFVATDGKNAPAGGG